MGKAILFGILAQIVTIMAVEAGHLIHPNLAATTALAWIPLYFALQSARKAGERRI